MMDEKQFNALVDEIVSQGYSEETAAEYASLIGDVPVRDDRGRILVLEGTRILARLEPLKFFGLD